MRGWDAPGYTELTVLGSGGFGDVVLARHDASGTRVAIKYLHRELLEDPGFAEMFRAEARTLVLLDDPNVVRLYEYIESPAGAAIVMELVDGVSVREILSRRGKTSAEAALVVLQGSLLGLAAAHARGVVHRDYKPENVLVDGAGVSKLTDFGIAARSGDRPVPAGTLAYAPPEQLGGFLASPAGDVYAATATFYECLAGRPPFTGDTAEALLYQHLSVPVPLEPVPEPLRPLVSAGLAKNPADRPADAASFVAELRAAARPAYGQDWEDHGRSHLGEAALLLAALWPSGAAPAVQGHAVQQVHLSRDPRQTQDPAHARHLEHLRHLEHVEHVEHLEHLEHLRAEHLGAEHLGQPGQVPPSPPGPSTLAGAPGGEPAEVPVGTGTGGAAPDAGAAPPPGPGSAAPRRLLRRPVGWAALAVIALAIAGIAVAVSRGPGHRPAPQPSRLSAARSGTPAATAVRTAYVVDSGAGTGDTVTPIELATGTAGPPITVGNSPYGIAITPDGKTAYVTNINDGTVTPINLVTGRAASPITVGNDPEGIAITPDGKTAYVCNAGDGTVTPIDLATGTTGSPITVGNGPMAIAITPDGKTAYVADGGGGKGDTVTPVDLTTGTAGAPITVGNYPYAIAITPDGKTAYVANFNDGTVTPITLATGTPGAPIHAGQYPSSIAITPDGKTAYVTNGASGFGNTVTPINLATGTVGPPITVGSEPMAIAITPDGKTAYVVNFADGTVTPITLATGTVGAPISVGNYPEAIAITP